MTGNNSMLESFKMMLDTDKGFVISQIGRPSVSFPSFSIYHRNGLWMVLYFQETRIENTLHSLLKGITFFDESLKLLWTSGIKLIPASSSATSSVPSTINEVLELFGAPHATFGASIATLQYLSEDGSVVFVKYSEDKIVDISSVSLPELAKLC